MAKSILTARTLFTSVSYTFIYSYKYKDATSYCRFTDRDIPFIRYTVQHYIMRDVQTLREAIKSLLSVIITSLTHVSFHLLRDKRTTY